MWKLEKGLGSVWHNCALIGPELVLELGSKVLPLPAAGEGAGWRACITGKRVNISVYLLSADSGLHRGLRLAGGWACQLTAGLDFGVGGHSPAGVGHRRHHATGAPLESPLLGVTILFVFSSPSLKSPTRQIVTSTPFWYMLTRAHVFLFLPNHCLSLPAQPWIRSTKAPTCSHPSDALQACVGERAEPMCAVGLHWARGELQPLPPTANKVATSCCVTSCLVGCNITLRLLQALSKNWELQLCCMATGTLYSFTAKCLILVQSLCTAWTRGQKNGPSPARSYELWVHLEICPDSPPPDDSET